jgi:two-component system OmpR family response regulator
MRYRVLIVDDDPDLVSLLDVSLRVAGYDIARAERGDEALAMVRVFDPHVMVLDIMMPGMTGFDVLKQLRTELADPPEVVILSARTNSDDIVLGKELGAFTYLFKPIARTRLIECIEAALAVRVKRQSPFP